MTADNHIRDDLLSLSAQLNRRAFAQPPAEGWLRSFLADVYQRVAPASIEGIQIAQVIGNSVVQMGSAGHIPASAVEPYPLDQAPAISKALRSGLLATAPGVCVYPLPAGEQVIAVLIVYADRPGSGIDDLFTALSLQLGPALMPQFKVGQHTGQLIQRIDLMRSLYEINQAVSSALEIDEVLMRSARSLVETLRVDHTSIVVFDYARSTGQVIAEYPDNGHVGAELQLRGYAVQERLERDHEPIVINNVDESEELGPNRPLLQEFGVKTMMVVPMIVQGELIGSVSLDVYYGPRSFTLDEFESAMAITAQLAISVRNAQLYSRVKRQAEQLETIADLSRQISSTLDRRRIFQIVREGIPKLISTDLIGVALREANRSTLQLFILGDGDPSLTEFEANQTGLNLICNTAEPLVIDDISDADYPDYQLLAERGMHAALIVPLISGGNVVGALSVMSRQARAYAPSELSVVEQIGNQLVGALENARLYTQTSQRAETERLMNRLGSGVQGQDDMHRMLLTTVQDIADALGARRARVRLQTPPAQTMDAAKLASLSSRIADKLSRKREG